MGTHMNKELNAKKFIEIWQSSKTLEEVAEKMHEPKTAIANRAQYYRKRGIPLKKFAQHYDWDSLKNYAESFTQVG